MSANWWEAAPVTEKAKDKPAPARAQPPADDSWFEQAPVKGAASDVPAEEPAAAAAPSSYDPSTLPPRLRPVEFTLPGFMEQLGPPVNDPGWRVSKPSPHTVPSEPTRGRPMPEIEVVGHRAPPDTRPIAGYADVFNTDFLNPSKGWFQSPFAPDLSTSVGAMNEMARVGTLEVLQPRELQAKTRFLQAQILPEAYQNWKKEKAAAEAAGLPVPDLNQDPLVLDAAERVGLPPEKFVMGLNDFMGKTQGWINAYKEQNRKLMGEHATYRADLEHDRKLAEQVMGEAQPRFEGEYSGPAIAWDLGMSAEPMLGSIVTGGGAGMVLGRGAGALIGAGTLGAQTAAQEVAAGKNKGLSDPSALVYGLAKGAAEAFPELPAMGILLKSPGGKQFMEWAFGKLSKGKIGHIAGAIGAEAGSEILTEALGIGIERGILDEHTPIGEAIDRLFHAGLLGGLMGGSIATVTSPISEPPPQIPEWARQPEGAEPDQRWTPPTTNDLASILAPKEDAPGPFNLAPLSPEALAAVGPMQAQPTDPAAPFVPSDIQPDLPLPVTQPELQLPGGGAIEKPEPQPELPLGTIVAPASTGSRSPELDSARASAPVAPDIQGTASPLSSPSQTGEPQVTAASPATPAPTEPAPTPAPQAQPAVSTAQEQPAGEAASITALRENKAAPVRKYEVDPRGGIEPLDAGPQWEELPGGWRKREYIAEFDGQRNPVQELRTPAGKRYIRGIDHDGKPFDLSPSAAKLFDQFFDQPSSAAAGTPAKVEPAAPAPEKPAAPTLKTGKRETVTTAVGTKVDTEYEVVEADDLVTSDKPEYPKQLQPRERASRVTSQEQVSKMGGSIDPDLLGPSPHAEHGAPIIGSDDNNVESGNGRVMALRQMYSRDPERAQKYREMVAAQSGQDVSQMRNPVLVRRRKTPMTDAERVKFAKEANKTSVSRMSAGEQAKVDQEALTPEVLAKLPEDMDEGFDLSKGSADEFIEAFVSKFPVAERGELVEADGKPSATAVSRAKAALLQKAFGGTPAGDAAIRRAVESTSSDAQTLINTLVRFAGPFAKLREDIAAGRIQDQADIGSKLAEAIEVVRAAGGPGGVTNWLKTEGLLNPKDPVVKQLIETFYSFDGRGNAKRLRTGGAIGTTLNEYLKLAQGYTAEQAGGGLFGEEVATPKLDPAAALGTLNAARRDQEQRSERQAEAAAKAQQGLFTARGEPSGPVPSGPSDANSGEETPATGPRESGDESDAEARAAQEEAELEKKQEEAGQKSKADIREFRQLKKTDPEFKRVTAGIHPESGFAGETFKGWKDAKAGTPIDPQHAQQMLPTADMKPHGFNPIQGYLVGYAAALGMKPPTDIRAFDALDWLRKVAAEQEQQFEEPAASQDEEMTGLDEDVGTMAATEGEETGDDVSYDEDQAGDEAGELSDKLSGKTGTVPRGPNIPGKSTTVDPLQTIGQRKADEIAQQIEKDRQPEVAPKRETELRESQYDSMWRDLHGSMRVGETPEEYASRQEAFVQMMRGLPIRQQLEYAQRRLKAYFDFKGIQIDPALNSREALDAMLDAYNNLHTQASIMGQPKEAMGFNGDLTLTLDKSINKSPDTRGQFSWNFAQGFGASVLSLARRADSFTHEWLHALDLNLLMRFTKRRAMGVSGASNLTLTALPELPKAVHDAFIRVMRAILLTDEASMTKLANLTVDAQQTQTALTKAKQKLRKAQGVFDARDEREKKAVQYEKDANQTKDPLLAASRRRAADQLRAGNRKAATMLATQKAEVAKLEAKLKQIGADMKDTLTNKASALAQNSRFVDFMQGRKYFSIPAELFARAGESWMGNRVGQQSGVEFLAGSPNYYNAHTDEIMALVYPNEVDRTRIFAAFDDLFSALAAEQYFAGTTVASKIPQPNRLEKELWLAAQRNAEVHAVRAAFDASKSDLDALWRLFKKIATPVETAKAAYAGGKDYAVAIAEGAKQILYRFHTGRGRLNGMVAKAKAAGNLRLAARLRTFARLLTDDPGSGELQKESLEQEFVRQSTADLNEFHDIVKRYELDPDNEAQMAQLHEELAKPTAQVLAELQDYKEFLQDKLDATKGDRNKVRTAEALKFQIAALQKKMDGFAKPSTAPGNILKAADEIRTLMNTAYYRQQDAGIDVGYVSNYMSRTMDDDAINANRAGFVDQAQAVYDFELHRKARALNRKLGQLENELRSAKSVVRNLGRGETAVDEIKKQMAAIRAEIAELANVDTLRAAQDWLYSSQVADMFQADRSTPPSNYTKARKLGPIADILMSEFYDQNPLSSVQRYLPMAAKRAAYARRFGNDHAKYEQMRHEFLAAGMEPADLKTVDEQLKIMSGTYSPNINQKLRAVTDALYNTATNALLPFSLFAQLAEPLSAGIRTGRLRDGFMNIAYTAQQLIRRGNAAELRQIAEIMGLISSAGTDTIVQSRMFQEDISGKTAVISNFFYRVTGVHGYTAASRIATMKLGGRYLSSWADTYLNSKPGSKERAAAEEEFRELGVPPKTHERFAKYVQQQQDMMSINTLLKPDDAEIKQHYVVAMHRFVDVIIGNPKASDRAQMASNPVGRFIMSISSFNYFFQRHVLTRFGKRLQRSDQKMRTTMQFVLPFLSLMVGTMLARMLREWLQDRDKFERRVEELATVKGFFNAIDAAGGTGGFSPLYNLIFKSKFQKDFSTLAMGAAMGFYIDSAQDIYDGFSDTQDPKDHTSTAERKRARAFYRLMVNSAAPRVLEAIGLRGPLGWLALTYFTSYNTAQDFANLTVGKTPNEKAKEAAAARKRPASPASEARKKYREDKKQRDIEKRYGK